MAFALNASKYVPPPNIREDVVTAYAHCPDPRCQGVKQELVQAVKETTEWTFASRGGGDDPGGIGNLFLQMVENSHTRLSFVDPLDLVCSHCGKDRELSDAPRPSYPIQIGGANALLRLQDMGLSFDPDRQEQIAKGAPETSEELLRKRYINDELTDEQYATKRASLNGTGADPSEVLAAMQAQIDALLAARSEEPAKRGPGRPRKEPE